MIMYGATEGIGGGKEMPNASDINGMMKGFQENERIINEMGYLIISR